MSRRSDKSQRLSYKGSSLLMDSTVQNESLLNKLKELCGPGIVQFYTVGFLWLYLVNRLAIGRLNNFAMNAAYVFFESRKDL